MTQAEFEERTNMELKTVKEFELVNEMYLDCEALDKDEFCDDYLKHGDSRIIRELLTHLHNANTIVDELLKKKERLFEILIEQSELTGNDILREEARNFYSPSTYVIKKIEMGYDITSQADKEIIIKHLYR